MTVTFREFITEIHGMGFGALFLSAFSGALMVIYRLCTPGKSSPLSKSEQTLFGAYLISMVVLAWGAVLSGAYFVYPWYRAHPPAGVTDLTEYPQRSLMANPSTAGWHDVGMEWKEHVAWFAPIAMTMVAYVVIKYSSQLGRHRQVRNAVVTFFAAALFAAGIAGFFGAMINKHAPVIGGATMKLMGGAK
jgi:hypothetical protein